MLRFSSCYIETYTLNIAHIIFAVDGVRFAFDPSKPAGSRVVPGSVYVRDRPLVMKRHTLIRGQKIDTSGIGNVNNDLNAEDKVDSGAPKGFSPLNPIKTYSLVSKAYLIDGKVRAHKATPLFVA